MKRSPNQTLPGQLDLFAPRPDETRAPEPSPTRALNAATFETPKPAPIPKRAAPPVRRTAPAKPAVLIREDEMPIYDRDEIALVDAAMADMPASKLWFTYQDIQQVFGVSRATVARKVKAGLVPGIRFVDGRVVEEGAVRRFSRTQIRFVLLAVRPRDVAAPAS